MEKISFGKFLTKDSIVVLHAEDKKTAFDQLEYAILRHLVKEWAVTNLTIYLK